jgi:AAHS family 4-hydroxybenzoate transporter-like MFS transporter
MFEEGNAMTTTAIDVHEEIATAKVGPLHWMLAAMMGALTFFDGYDTFNPAYVIHYVAGPWGLAPGQAGLLVSSGLVGFLIGAAGHGVFADRFGRRGTLLGGLWITNIFTLATALFADSFLSFCILRVLTGIGLGVLMPLERKAQDRMRSFRPGCVRGCAQVKLLPRMPDV